MASLAGYCTVLNEENLPRRKYDNSQVEVVNLIADLEKASPFLNHDTVNLVNPYLRYEIKNYSDNHRVQKITSMKSVNWNVEKQIESNFKNELLHNSNYPSIVTNLLTLFTKKYPEDGINLFSFFNHDVHKGMSIYVEKRKRV